MMLQFFEASLQEETDEVVKIVDLAVLELDKLDIKLEVAVVVVVLGEVPVVVLGAVVVWVDNIVVVGFGDETDLAKPTRKFA